MRFFVSALLLAAQVHAQSLPFLGKVIREDGGDSGRGEYIFPNEIYPDAWQPVLHGKRGAYVSVGTFRTLHTAAYNDFSHVIMFDYDPTTTEFNRLNLELIRASPTRAEYLSLLSGREVSPSFLEGIGTRDYKKVKLTNPADLSALPPLSEESLNQVPASVRDRYREFFEPRRKEFQTFVEGVRRKNSIIGSDKIYRSLRQQALEGKFTVIHANAIGDTAFKDLGHALHSSGVEVSAVDLSNVLEHISWNSKILENLEALPLAKDAQILFTVWPGQAPSTHPAIRNGRKTLNEDGWVYNARPYPEFAAAIRNVRGRFLAGLLDTQGGHLHRNNNLITSPSDPCVPLLERILRPREP